MRLSLGTVQLGVPYGVNNAAGQLTDGQAEAVLDAALTAGFSMLDTSHEYGEAITRVGRFLRAHPGAFEVVVKYSAQYPPGVMERLRLRTRVLLPGGALSMVWTAGESVAALDPSGFDGVTLYDVAEAEVVPAGFRMVQVPGSCLDGRMDEEIPRLKARGHEVAVRSLLLQGLLTSDPVNGPAGHVGNAAFRALAVPYLLSLREMAYKWGMSVLELAVRWAFELGADVAVLGAETPAQALEIGWAMGRGPLPWELVDRVRSLRAGIPEVVISPIMWGQTYPFTIIRDE